ncbi:MAG: hydantoinase/oxoprolinase family protein [Chloroflexi bacterium]|nr:hydantoinase/oxoprolinase family protein [Chloroflexota bacterium]
MKVRIGIDVGGTFTDLAIADEATGNTQVFKLPTTPADPSVGILAGITQALELRELAAGDVSYLAHGTTVATNALLEGKAAPVGLVTTGGCRDLLELGRQARQGMNLYDLKAQKPRPLVPRRFRLEVRERLLADGSVHRPLDLDEVAAAVGQLVQAGLGSIAVCFLHAYANPTHEQAAAARIRERYPDIFVTTSHAVAPEFREFERFTTTVLDAALRPVMTAYLDRFAAGLKELGVTSPGFLMQSNGGVVSLSGGDCQAVKTIASGPSAGVMGAIHAAGKSGQSSLITFDMGGTSTDVCLVRDGEPASVQLRLVGGYPVRTPMLDVHSIGAGGGSIARVDGGGLLKVGPQSAGADPGPACYGRGGEYPTVTDANVLLHRLNPEHLLGGRMAIDRARAEAAIRRYVAEPLGIDPVTAAAGILRVVNAGMMRAIRVVSVEKGFDPRDFALVGFGGAGPLHATAVARDLNIPLVVVPERPGILCAMGLLVSDRRTDFVRTHLLPATAASLDRANAAFVLLEQEGRAWLERQGVPPEDRAIERSIDMRYHRQNYELTIPVADHPLHEADLAALLDRFHRRHQQVYGLSAPGEPVQLVSFRVVARGRARPLATTPPQSLGARKMAAPVEQRPVSFGEAGAFVSCPVYDRDRLEPHQQLVGPAIVEQMDSTTVIHPGQRLLVDEHRNLIIFVGGDDARRESAPRSFATTREHVR